MIHLTGNIEYEGGRIERFETGSAAIAEWELYALRHGYPPKVEDAPRMLMMLVIAHHALGVEEGFEVWRKSVVGLEDTSENVVPPTLPARTAA